MGPLGLLKIKNRLLTEARCWEVQWKGDEEDRHEPFLWALADTLSLCHNAPPALVQLNRPCCTPCALTVRTNPGELGI